MDEGDKAKQQRITLKIQDLRVPLLVDPAEEDVYRHARTMLDRRIDDYRSRYPASEQLPSTAYITMAALDRAYYVERYRVLADTKPWIEKIKTLNTQIESFLAE